MNSNWSYGPETPNLGQNWRFFEPRDLEIWRMTFKNNRAPLLCYFKLCAAFRSHWWIQTGAINGLCWNINTPNTHQEDFVHIHQLTNYASKRLNEERMHQKYENIGCYKHIQYNCFPNYNLDGSIQDEKKIVLLSFLSATIRPPETPMKKKCWPTLKHYWTKLVHATCT